MRKLNYEIGTEVGDLTIIECIGKSGHGDYLYKCKCKCGNIVTKKATILKIVSNRGYINSCGCRKKIKSV